MATAEQTVSAVLDATNKRYVVETYKTDDGLGGYTLYSDGFCEQWGVELLKATNSGSSVEVILFKPYGSEKFNVIASVWASRSSGWAWGAQAKPIDETTIAIFIGGLANDGISWQTKGYIV